MRRAPTSLIALSTFFIPPIVTASATSGFIAVSTERGAARFQTVVFSSPYSWKSLRTVDASHTSMPPVSAVRTAAADGTGGADDDGGRGRPW